MRVHKISSDDMFRTPTKEEELRSYNPYDFSNWDSRKLSEPDYPINFNNSYVHLVFKNASLKINGVDESQIINSDMLENIELLTKVYNDLSQKEEKEYKFSKQRKLKKIYQPIKYANKGNRRR